MALTLLVDCAGLDGWLLDAGSVTRWRPGMAVPAQARVLGVVPGEHVGLHLVRLPARRPAELRQAVPFALEERLAEPVESLHFALGRRTGDGSVEVAVVARERMRTWLDALGGLGLSVDALVADAHLLPREEGQLAVLALDDRVLAAHHGMACAVAAQDWPQWRSLAGDLPMVSLDAQGRWQPAKAPVSLAGAERARWWLAQSGQAPDLLQDAFPARRLDAGRRRLWRTAAVLAGLALLLAVAEALLAVHAGRKQQAAMRAQMAQVFAAVLPDLRMTADPAAQLAAELGRRRSDAAGEELLPLLLRIAPVLSQGSRYRLDALDWRVGVLELEVAAADVAGLDALRESLATLGLAVELTGVDPVGSQVRGRLRVRGGTA
ncbi:MAG: hypothetical protein KF823_14125 [Xanthomonadales bacterium]|nr:hypothetical protein [Xanthomonadales bacterium]